MLRPLLLRSHATTGPLAPPKDKPWRGYQSLLGMMKDKAPVLALNVPRESPRQKAQSAAYTFSPGVTSALDAMTWPREHELNDGSFKSEHLEILSMPHDSKPALLEELAMCRISRSVLFPDLDGVSRLVMDRYKALQPGVPPFRP